LTTATLRLGQALFRLRSLTPVPVVGLCLWALWASRAQVPAFGAFFAWAGLGLALLGQALRYFTLGWVPEGTSGQNLTLQASTLNTRGPYAHVRNPLYVGNLGIVAGLLCMAGNGFVAVVGLAFFFGEYFFIIRAEEHFLRGKFGEAFDTFCASVPRWVPRVTPAYAHGRLRDGGFDWQRALKKEINPFAAWVSGAMVVLLWQRWVHGVLESQTSFVLAALWSGTLLALLIIKAWKKGWLFT
jgi:protein-S-isoprenylcysteine O-methyltransferase Ste14